MEGKELDKLILSSIGTISEVNEMISSCSVEMVDSNGRTITLSGDGSLSASIDGWSLSLGGYDEGYVLSYHREDIVSVNDGLRYYAWRMRPSKSVAAKLIKALGASGYKDVTQR